MSNQEILNKKNITALAGAEKKSRAKFDEILDRIEKLERTVATQAQEIVILKQQSVIANKVIGPTS